MNSNVGERNKGQEKEMDQSPQSSRRFELESLQRRLLAFCIDLAALSCSAILSFELRFDGAVPRQLIRPMWAALCIWVAVKSAAFITCRVSWNHWRHTSVYDGLRVILANSAGSMVGGVIIFILLGPPGVPRSVYFIDWLVACSLTLGGRAAVRAVITSKMLNRPDSEMTRALIYGAGSAGLALIWELRQNESLKCNVIGLIDDDPNKANMNLQGKRVLGTGKDLGALVRKHEIKRVLIAIPSATGPQMVGILEHVLEAQVEYKMVPSLGELIQDAELGRQIRDVAVEDLLGRKPVYMDQQSIRERIQGRVVLVTGAAGSIGSEICRQIAPFRPLALVGFDEAETPLFQIDRELRKSFPVLSFHHEIGSITRPDTLRQVMLKYHPSVVYHAAAFKHVPMMEEHVFAAVENNIFGTWHVASAAAKHGVEDFVMISTDKAVRPTSMMGATKAVAELAIRALFQQTSTKFVAVRFGNVLGSNGSVVPIFKEQIAAGGPVTVTHPQMTRYFMTIPEAAQLVLQAFSMAKGGEVFVLDMGEPVKIVDLAKNLILLSGLQPDRDIKIQFSGVRPGEKLFEEVSLQSECLIETSHSKIRSYVRPFDIDPRRFRLQLQELKQIVEVQDVAALVLWLKELIPDYNPTSRYLHEALLLASKQALPRTSPVFKGRPETPVDTRQPSAALTN
jgi:FlaA1/EpsC-like NDP-sugar epimerase